MRLGELFFSGRKSDCQLHDGHAKKANRTLQLMLAACFGLIVWQVWANGPSSTTGISNPETVFFPLQVAYEIWDLLSNVHGIAAELRDVFPYFFVGVLLAGYLRTFKIAVKLQATLKKYGTLSIVVASVVGIITPLCACGTITTAVSLLFAGLPLAPVMALMTTSALLSPSTYLITLNDLGPEWTVIRTISALLMGLFAGAVTLILCKRGFDKGGLFIEGAVVPGDFHDEDYPIEHLRCNCREKFGNRVAIRTSNKFLIFLAKTSEMFWTVGKYILVGVAIGSIVERYMPNDWIYRFFGRQDPFNIVWITFSSVPLFLHQISASSILSHIKNSLHGTLDGGAALAFMIGGPVTAIPTMVLFWTIFKKRVFVLYMFVCLFGTILIASVFQWLIFVPGIDTGNKLFTGVSSVAGGRSSTLLKEGKNIRIVLDPTGKSVVATYSDELANNGSIVFDAALGRFSAAAAGVKDDRHYVTNIATWLEQNSSSPDGRKIIIYTIGASGGDSSTVSAGVADVLRQAKFDVTLVDRNSSKVITNDLLTDSGQLWLLFGESARNGQLTENEIKLVSSFNGRGNGMLIAADSRGGAFSRDSSINQLTLQYGVEFSGSTENKPRISVGMTSQLFTTASILLGKFLKIVHKA
ncbi:MAG: permease [Desulfuromonadaceae bacterium]|nr:permease [Desulfuromonadaceae bacterium]MDD2856166.1 permease [Desulfuromonadaceae bacterium]